MGQIASSEVGDFLSSKLRDEIKRNSNLEVENASLRRKLAQLESTGGVGNAAQAVSGNTALAEELVRVKVETQKQLSDAHEVAENLHTTISYWRDQCSWKDEQLKEVRHKLDVKGEELVRCKKRERELAPGGQKTEGSDAKQKRYLHSLVALEPVLTLRVARNAKQKTISRPIYT